MSVTRVASYRFRWVDRLGNDPGSLSYGEAIRRREVWTLLRCVRLPYATEQRMWLEGVASECSWKRLWRTGMRGQECESDVPASAPVFIEPLWHAHSDSSQ